MDLRKRRRRIKAELQSVQNHIDVIHSAASARSGAAQGRSGARKGAAAGSTAAPPAKRARVAVDSIAVRLGTVFHLHRVARRRWRLRPRLTLHRAPEVMAAALPSAAPPMRGSAVDAGADQPPGATQGAAVPVSRPSRRILSPAPSAEEEEPDPVASHAARVLSSGRRGGRAVLARAADRRAASTTRFGTASRPYHTCGSSKLPRPPATAPGPAHDLGALFQGSATPLVVSKVAQVARSGPHTLDELRVHVMRSLLGDLLEDAGSPAAAEEEAAADTAGKAAATPPRRDATRRSPRASGRGAAPVPAPVPATTASDPSSMSARDADKAAADPRCAGPARALARLIDPTVGVFLSLGLLRVQSGGVAGRASRRRASRRSKAGARPPFSSSLGQSPAAGTGGAYSGRGEAGTEAGTATAGSADGSGGGGAGGKHVTRSLASTTPSVGESAAAAPATSRLQTVTTRVMVSVPGIGVAGATGSHTTSAQAHPVVTGPMMAGVPSPIPAPPCPASGTPLEQVLSGRGTLHAVAPPPSGPLSMDTWAHIIFLARAGQLRSIEAQWGSQVLSAAFNVTWRGALKYPPPSASAADAGSSSAQRQPGSQPDAAGQQDPQRLSLGLTPILSDAALVMACQGKYDALRRCAGTRTTLAAQDWVLTALAEEYAANHGLSLSPGRVGAHAALPPLPPHIPLAVSPYVHAASGTSSVHTGPAASASAPVGAQGRPTTTGTAVASVVAPAAPASGAQSSGHSHAAPEVATASQRAPSPVGERLDGEGSADAWEVGDDGAYPRSPSPPVTLPAASKLLPTPDATDKLLTPLVRAVARRGVGGPEALGKGPCGGVELELDAGQDAVLGHVDVAVDRVLTLRAALSALKQKEHSLVLAHAARSGVAVPSDVLDASTAHARAHAASLLRQSRHVAALARGLDSAAQMRGTGTGMGVSVAAPSGTSPSPSTPGSPVSGGESAPFAVTGRPDQGAGPLELVALRPFTPGAADRVRLRRHRPETAAISKLTPPPLPWLAGAKPGRLLATAAAVDDTPGPDADDGSTAGTEPVVTTTLGGRPVRTRRRSFRARQVDEHGAERGEDGERGAAPELHYDEQGQPYCCAPGGQRLLFHVPWHAAPRVLRLPVPRMESRRRGMGSAARRNTASILEAAALYQAGALQGDSNGAGAGSGVGAAGSPGSGQGAGIGAAVGTPGAAVAGAGPGSGGRSCSTRSSARHSSSSLLAVVEQRIAPRGSLRQPLEPPRLWPAMEEEEGDVGPRGSPFAASVSLGSGSGGRGGPRSSPRPSPRPSPRSGRTGPARAPIAPAPVPAGGYAFAYEAVRSQAISWESMANQFEVVRLEEMERSRGGRSGTPRAVRSSPPAVPAMGEGPSSAGPDSSSGDDRAQSPVGEDSPHTALWRKQAQEVTAARALAAEQATDRKRRLKSSGVLQPRWREVAPDRPLTKEENKDDDVRWRAIWPPPR